MLEVGLRVGHYKIEKSNEIKSDNVNEVHLADVIDEHLLKHRVIIKIVKNYNRNYVQKSVKFWQRLPEHRNIVKLLEVAYINSDVFLVMEYVERRDLRKHLDKFHSSESICKLLLGIIEGIIHIHSQKPPLIHQDIKPENILLRADDTPLLTDFSSSRTYDSENRLQVNSEPFSGTYSYASPQAILGKIDPHNDLWAVGIIAYELLSGGRQPFSDIINKCVFEEKEIIAESIKETIADSAELDGILQFSESYQRFEPFIKTALNLGFNSAVDMQKALLKIMNNDSTNSFFVQNETTGNSEIDQKINECIKSIRSLITQPDQHFRIEILKEILNGLKSELNELNANTYEFDIGTEKNFLLRATPLFENAHKVYAISLDTISSFWTKSERQSVRIYIERQPINTIRLFVFKTPKRAHQYSKILDANDRWYGSSAAGNKGSGMVLVSSFESYQNFLSSYTDLNLGEYQEKDFGLLNYGDYFIEATLDISQLRFREQTNHRETKFKRMIEKLDELLMLQEGEMDPITKFLKWSPSFLNNRELWAEKLSKMFEMRAGREYYHLVFFAPSVGQQIVVETKRRLIEKRKELGLDDVWVGTRQRANVADGEFGGLIDTGKDDEWNRILIMRFQGKDDMVKFYHHPIHSKIRKFAFSNFNNQLDNLYKQLLEEKDNFKRLELYHHIEREAKQFMERRDYVDAEDIYDLVKHEPIFF
jgi:serine/threonine protein kinase